MPFSPLRSAGPFQQARLPVQVALIAVEITTISSKIIVARRIFDCIPHGR